MAGEQGVSRGGAENERERRHEGIAFRASQATGYLDDGLRTAFAFPGFGIVVISARRTVLTDSDVGKTSEMSGSRTTMRWSL